MRSSASCLMLLLLLTGVARAQSEGTGEPVRLLNCRIEGHVPESPGVAQQGGYGFEYQSLRGVTEDDRACTVYRLKNTPDKPPTPFRWTLGDEVVVDKVRLPRCGGGADECPWLSFAKYFPGAIDTNLSVLSYGLNADAYHEQTDTYMNTVGLTDSEVAEARDIGASSVGTEIEGKFLNADDEPLPLHLIVKSRFEPDPAGATMLVYEIEDLAGGGALLSDDVRIEWDALSVVPEVVALLVEGAQEADATADATASTGPNRLEVRVPARAFVLDDSFEFRIFAAGEPEPLVVVDMPAYVPVASD